MADDLWSWSAHRLAAAISRREVSAREAAVSALTRLDLVNHGVNAVVELRPDEVLTAADQADFAVRAGMPLGKLHGVPVTTKINVDLQGAATSNGLRALAGQVASEDAPALHQWRLAGAVFLGRTNAPALSLRWSTDNALYGRTLNPLNPVIDVAGSSGGAAAAVACGIGALAHGNDLAGSTRLPAAACGVVGFRPTTGRMASYNATSPVERAITFQLGATQGVLARSVEDVRLGSDTMAGADWRDPWSLAVVNPQPIPQPPLRVALFDGGSSLGAKAKRALTAAANALADGGCIVEPASPPQFGEAADLWMRMLAYEVSASTFDSLRAITDPGTLASISFMAQCVTPLSAEDMLGAFARRTTLQRMWGEFFTRWPILLMPTTLCDGFPIDHDLAGIEATGELIAAHRPVTATALLGLPAISVPVRENGQLVASVQIVCARHFDPLCLDVAAVIEAAFGPAPTIDPIRAAASCRA